jgi:hypothetical protein
VLSIEKHIVWQGEAELLDHRRIEAANENPKSRFAHRKSLLHRIDKGESSRGDQQKGKEESESHGAA